MENKIRDKPGWESNYNRVINIARWFLQGGSYFPIGFCLTEVPVAMLIEELDGYTMGQRGEERVKGTRCLFVDDIKIYEENYEQLEIVN